MPDSFAPTRNEAVEPLGRSRLRWLGCVAALAVAACVCATFAPFQHDDAYITYRYVRQLLAHGRLAFDTGGAVAEGFSSPLWLVLLSACAQLVGSDSLPACSALLGCSSLLLLLVLSMCVCDDSNAPSGDRALRLLPAGWLALMPACAFYAATGLEQALFLACVLGVSGAVAGRLPLPAGLVFGALAPWVRPEGAWTVVAIAAQQVALGSVAPARSLHALLRSPVARIVAAVAVGQLSVSAARAIVFGELYPNTYHAKEPVLAAGAAYLRELASQPWVITVLAMGVASLMWGGPAARSFVLAGVCWLFAALLEGGDWMPAGRLAAPGLALLVIAAGLWKLEKPRARAALVALTLAGALTCWPALQSLARRSISDMESIVHEQRFLALWLSDTGARSAALVDIGLFGFETELEITDLAGLTDPVIARAPGVHLDKRFDLSYLFALRQPDAVVIRVDSPSPRDDEALLRSLEAHAMSPIEARLLQDARFRDDYALAFAVFPSDMRRPFYGRAVYLRKGFSVRAPLPQRITYLVPLELD